MQCVNCGRPLALPSPEQLCATCHYNRRTGREAERRLIKEIEEWLKGHEAAGM